MGKISGKVIIRGAEIRTDEELHLKNGAFLNQCLIYCKALVQWDGDKDENAVGCLVYSTAGVGACYNKEKDMTKISERLIQEINDMVYEEECRELNDELVKRIVQYVISSMEREGK